MKVLHFGVIFKYNWMLNYLLSETFFYFWVNRSLKTVKRIDGGTWIQRINSVQNGGED